MPDSNGNTACLPQSLCLPVLSLCVLYTQKQSEQFLTLVQLDFCRLLGLALSYLATNKRFRLTVDAVSFLTVSGVRLQLHQVSSMDYLRVEPSESAV